MKHDISTPENRCLLKTNIKRRMQENLVLVLEMHNRLSADSRDHVIQKINAIDAIRKQIDEKARGYEYVSRCQEAISVCKGECCKWHFPKNIDDMDFLFAICVLTTEERESLLQQIAASDDQEYQCPLLRQDGCMLSFQTRPLTCAAAYPCFAGQSYWNFLEIKKKQINTLYQELNQVLKRQA